MIEKETIMQFSQAIANEFQPHKIILFGSYAYGNPQDDSDVDLLVILPYKGSSFRKTWEILNKNSAQVCDRFVSQNSCRSRATPGVE
jgi:Nucleotidyltransferase domain.